LALAGAGFELADTRPPLLGALAGEIELLADLGALHLDNSFEGV